MIKLVVKVKFQGGLTDSYLVELPGQTIMLQIKTEVKRALKTQHMIDAEFDLLSLTYEQAYE